MALPNDELRCSVRVAGDVGDPSSAPSPRRKLVIVGAMTTPIAE
jgi:hypothetical protein